MPDDAGGEEGGERGVQQDGEEGGGEEGNLLLSLGERERRQRKGVAGRAAGSAVWRVVNCTSGRKTILPKR